MPQPLSKVAPAANIVLGTVGASAIAQRPHLAVLAMMAIESASNVENFMLSLFVRLLGGDEAMATDVYLSLAAKGPKDAAINAAASRSLQKSEADILTAIQRIDATNKKSRDKIAHHVWGFGMGLDDALLLIDPQATVGSNIDRAKIFVYTKDDFTALIRANDQLCDLAWRFRNALGSPNDEVRKARFDALSNEPVIQERLQSRA